ncbi:nuclear transcription factor Y subunit B-3 [Tanacetum coccineum]
MADSDNESGGHNNNDLSAREQDRFLPIANVSRIMKKALPANAKISKDAKETVQECVSEFISFITGEASDKCQRERRKTINGDDLLWAMTTLGFEEYVEPLKVYLAKYREIEGEKTVGGRPADVNTDVALSGYNNNNNNNNNGMYQAVGGYPQQQQPHHMYNSGYNNQGMGTGASNLGRSGSFGGRGGGSGSGSTLKHSR